MKKKTCPRTAEVLAGWTNGHLNEELRRHVEHCPVCRDEWLVRSWMSDYANRAHQTVETANPLPSSETVWNAGRSARRSRKDLENRALRPLLYPQITAYVLAGGGALALVSGLWDPVKKVIGDYGESFGIFRVLAGSLGRVFTAFPLLTVLMSLGAVALLFYFLMTLIRPNEA